MALFADRFLLHTDPGTVDAENSTGSPRWCLARDVATQDAVTIVFASAGRADAWYDRCARFATLHHRHIALLVDYGEAEAAHQGPASRFEVWRAVRSPAAASSGARAAQRGAHAFLRAAGLSTGPDEVARWSGGPLIVPAAGTGHVRASPAAAIAAGDCALETIARPPVEAIAELVRDVSRREPSAIALWGPRGAGLRVAARSLARVARLSGMVPIAAHERDERVWATAADRSALIIAMEGELGWRRLLAAGARAARPHLLVILSEHEVSGVCNVRLDPIDVESMTGAVRPVHAARAHDATIRRAAARARGLPGTFASLLWHTPSSHYQGPRAPACRAAEPSAEYGEPTTARPAVRSRAWPVSAPVELLRRRLDAAVAALHGGRYISGERAVRGMVAALIRRGEHAAATQGLLALARARLRRGHMAAARAALDEACLSAQHAEDGAGMVDVACTRGIAAVDGGALPDAETILRGALATARARHPDRVGLVQGALARTLFWQGRYDDAAAAAQGEFGAIPDAQLVVLHAEAARSAVGARAADAGLAAAARAVAVAERLGEPEALGRATCAAAFTRLAADDRAGVLRDGARCLAAARAAHDPLRALRARLLIAEAHRRDGRPEMAVRLIDRVRRLPRGTLPACVQVRVDLLRGLTDGTDPDPASRLASSSGFEGVRLFAPRDDHSELEGTRTARDLRSLLVAIQEAPDEESAFGELCAVVRRTMRAAAVACVVPRGSTFCTLASAGGRVEAEVAGRALAAIHTIHHHSTGGGVTLSVPVRYGGRPVGAMVIRWGPGIDAPVERARAWVELAGAAAAPALAAAAARVPAPVAALDEIVGVSPVIQGMRQEVERAARAPYPVLVEGESGSGKELVARAVHRRSSRRDRACCTVNCAALPDDLLEAELFGHARGAFTGAALERAGVFEEAHGGTLFLDEVGELSPRAQAKLLRTLQEGEVRRLGENLSRRVDVRIVAATNRDLRQEVAAGRFRLDLLYRLDVVRIAVPPLRDRSDDIPLLVERFWQEAMERVRCSAVLSADAVAALARYPWPGNVRELQNVIAALAVAAPRRGVIRPSALPPAISGAARHTGRSLDAARRAVDERCVRLALARAGGHRGRAAVELGVSRQGLTKLMARLGITGAL